MSVTWLEDRVATVRATSRRGRLIGAGVLLGVVAALAGVVSWAWQSGRLDTVAVVVTGTQRTDAAVVEAIGATALGAPLLLADVAAVQDGVRALPLVADAEVRRRWPRTLEIEVVEREGVAAVPVPGGFQLLDPEGVVLAESAAPPAGVPVLRVDVPVAGVPALEAARAVLESLPVDVQQRVSDISATSAADVRLVLDGAEVRWGAATDNQQKLAVLQVLMSTVPAGGYDVSAPAAPATRP